MGGQEDVDEKGPGEPGRRLNDGGNRRNNSDLALRRNNAIGPSKLKSRE